MFAVVYLPEFVLQAALRHAPESWSKSVALVDPTATTPRVIAATGPARATGITEGLTPPQALARDRAVLIRHRSTAQEAATTDALLQVAYGFSPNLEHTAPGLVTLDLRGLAELTSPDRQPAWATRLHDAVRALDLRAQVGLGATPNLARHAAVWADGIKIVGDPVPFIASLPVAALEPTLYVAEILERWGIRRVGEFLALGQAELAERFGLEALALFAAASATALRPLKLVRPAERFEEAWEFEHEIETLEPLLFLLRRFVDSLGQRLEALGLAAAELHLRLRLESGETHEQRLRLPEPTRQPDALFRTLQTHLENVRTQSPVLGLALSAEAARPRQRQFSLFEAAVRDPHQFQETLARLSALVGSDRVGTPQRENTHRPDAFQLVPPDFDNAPAWGGRSISPLQSVTPVRRLRPARSARVEVRVDLPASASSRNASPGSPRKLRPLPVLKPEQIAAILAPVFRPNSPISPPPVAVDRVVEPPSVGPPNQPVALQSVVATGRLTQVLGPWYASGNWWESNPWSREEWDVQTDRGESVRLVKQDGQWWVDAVVD